MICTMFKFNVRIQRWNSALDSANVAADEYYNTFTHDVLVVTCQFGVPKVFREGLVVLASQKIEIILICV